MNELAIRREKQAHGGIRLFNENDKKMTALTPPTGFPSRMIRYASPPSMDFSIVSREIISPSSSKCFVVMKSVKHSISCPLIWNVA